MVFELLIIVTLAVIAVAVGVTKSRTADLNRSWETVAQKFGLTFETATWNKPPILSGFVEGRDLTVDVEKRHSGKHSVAWTRFRLGMESLDLGLKLRGEKFFDRVSKAFGTQDITIGDAAFDHEVLVQGNDDVVIREFMTPERRGTIRRFLNAFPTSAITDNEISVLTRGYVRKAGDVTGTIYTMLKLARTLTELHDDADSEPTTDYLLQGEADVQPTQSAAQTQRVENINRDESIILDKPPNAAGRDSDPHSAFSAPPGSPQIAEFCESVFAPGKMSFEATQTFRQDFEGKRVVWSGTLESASALAFDFDFGTKTAKAVLKIHANDTGSAGSHDTKAILALPAAIDRLDQLIGQPLTFAGTLLKVDGFARKVFLSNAAIES